MGRGNYTEDMIRDIRCMKRALEILDRADCEEAYIRTMKQEIFGDRPCSGRCYYR